MIKPLKVIWPTFIRRYGGWNQYIKMGFKELRIPIEENNQRLFGVSDLEVSGLFPFELIFDYGVRRIWYDPGCFYRHVYEKVMKPGDLYFKIRMKHDQKEGRPLMFPIGNRITRPEKFYPALSELRKIKEKKNYQYDLIALFKLTEVKKRTAAVKMIKENTDWRAIAGLMPHPHCLNVPSGLREMKLSYLDHLRKQASTKIGLALPGVGDLTFRQIEFMAIGIPCMITKPTLAKIGDPQNCWIEVENDLSDFVEKVKYYLKYDDEREEIGRNGLEFYEKYYSPKGQAEYILRIAEEYK